MNSRTFLAGLTFVPFALTHGGSGDRLAFQPKAGETMAKHFEVASELELEESTFELDGQDMSELMGSVDMGLKTTMKLNVTDAYESVADGRPSKLKRTYDGISSATHVSASNPQTGETEKDIPASSELEGTTVVFSWNDSDDSYDIAFAGDDGDKKLLEDLWEDLDLRGFLPENEVASDDSWKIPADAVKALLAPGGDLKLRPEGDLKEMSGMEQFSPSDIVGSLEGEF